MLDDPNEMSSYLVQDMLQKEREKIVHREVWNKAYNIIRDELERLEKESFYNACKEIFSRDLAGKLRLAMVKDLGDG